ncbi:MAG: GCN5-related N-acetyltransferase [Pseudomonadota bacterium]
MTGDLFEASSDAIDDLRRRYRTLVHTTLPAAARSRGWPIHLDHCFARVLLDCACERPWAEVIARPAWRNAPEAVLTRAIELGEAALSGDADMAELNRRSLMLRGKLAGRSPPSASRKSG